MNEKLNSHIEMLFENAPKTRKAIELKEELLANTKERYGDLITSGISAEDAYKNAVNSIGNVSELFQGLEETNMDAPNYQDDKFKKIAIYKTAAIGIYIFSGVLFLGFTTFSLFIRNRFEYTIFGLLIALLIDIIPTCMLVYITSLYPKYNKKNNTVVEDFKEWKSSSLKKKSIQNAIISMLWTLTVLLYFIISFTTFAWYATWIIFLIALCIQTIIILYFRIKE